MPAKKKARGKGSAADESVKGVYTQGDSTPNRKGRSAKGLRDSGNGNGAERKGIKGVKGGPSAPGTKNPERRCTATARNTGEQCKRAAIKGGTVCTTHGGNLPQVKQSAKDRLLALVDPALAALDQVLRSKDADDAHKVRAALGILDRTGFRPGVDITVHEPTPWELLSKDEVIEIDSSFTDGEDDRALPRGNRPALAGGGGEHTPEDLDTFAKDAQSEAWSDLDAEDDEPYATRLDRFGPNVVQGEVVEPD